MKIYSVYSKFYDFFMKKVGLFRDELIIENLLPKSTDRILDMAGGTGYIASQIAKKAGKVVVVDTSARMLKKAEKYKQLELHIAKAQETPFTDNSFDGVVCINALHHIKEIEKTVDEMKRIMKPGGRVVVLDFDTKSVLGKMLSLFERTFIDDSRFVRPHVLQAIFKERGFEGSTQKISKIQYIYSGSLQK